MNLYDVKFRLSAMIHLATEAEDEDDALDRALAEVDRMDPDELRAALLDVDRAEIELIGETP